jgi:hypothetical protein
MGLFEEEKINIGKNIILLSSMFYSLKKMFFSHKEKRKYSADMSLQERRQEKNMVNWLKRSENKTLSASSAITRGK